MRLLLLVLLLTLCGSAQAGPSVETLWKARGLEAIEKLKTMEQGEPNSAQRLAYQLEEAFALHATRPEAVYRRTDTYAAYTIFIPSPDSDGFALEYKYDTSGVLLSCSVDSLPPGWSVTFDSRVAEFVQLHRIVTRRTDTHAPLPIMVLPLPRDGYVIFDTRDPFGAFDSFSAKSAFSSSTPPSGEAVAAPKKNAAKPARSHGK